MATILITGANRGLGLEFSRQYADAGWTVIACCRSGQSPALLELARQYSDLQIEALDVADFDQIDALARKLSTTKIDVLINNAGVYGDRPEQGFGRLNYQTWTQTLQINTQAPVKMAEAFISQLTNSEQKLLVNISSQMASMADNNSGGSLLYRSSKAALNAAMKSLAIDLQRQSIGVLIFHPGWVKTDMGGPNALINVETSVSGMRNVIANFSLDQSGRFVKYDGTALPW